MKFLITIIISLNIFAYEMAVDKMLLTYYPKYILLLKKVYADLGLPMTYVTLPTPRAISGFNNSKINALDAKIGSVALFCPRAILINPPIVDKFVFGLWKLKNDKYKYVSGTKVIGVRGAFFVDVFMKKFGVNEKDIIYTRDTETAFEMIKLGRAHFVISDFGTVLNQPFSKDFEFVEEVSTAESVHHIISPDLLEYKERIEKIFKEYKGKGFFNLENIKEIK